MQINFNDAAGKTHSVSHDLNFASAKYETKHVITFKNPKAPSAILSDCAAAVQCQVTR